MVIVLAVFLLLPLMVTAEAHTQFIFNQFNGSSLTLIGDVSIRSNSIWLTNQSQHLVGRAFYPQPVRMKEGNATLSFSTTFVFCITPQSSDRLRSGQGMAFVLTPHKSLQRASSAQFLGLFNSSSNGQPYNHLFAVEFDTTQNEEFQDINDNHVGVDLDGLTSFDSKPAGYWVDGQFRDLNLNNGQNIQAWIEYSDLQQKLDVSIAPAGSGLPSRPLVSRRNMSLSNILKEEMYVGFSAATGTVVEDHCVLAWSFTTNGVSPFLNTSHLPSFRERKSQLRLVASLTTAFIVLLFLVIAAVVVELKRKRHRYVMEEWEVEYWPHRFDYKDLCLATMGFRDDHVIGCGGFGRVYRGVLPSSGLQVAVKCILRESSEGLKEFIAEISSLGRLQHRNLVQIRGYCRRGRELFIVYDYMSNGSLDKMIFGNPERLLGWAQRYRILRDVAAGLLYLHEEWERRVVHRDIKSSNVLLDSELNGKLGDFGLARLYEHNENPHTTHVVGTLGYIAPELVHTGKAAPASDVFSFGILMLEVACGRRPVDRSLDDAQIVLVEWLRHLHAKGNLTDAADPKLCGQYVKEEMERVLKLGLLCCHPQPEARLSIRQIVQILEGEASRVSYIALPSSFPFPSENTTSQSSFGIGASFASTSASLEAR